jgi:hypothetical protein
VYTVVYMAADESLAFVLNRGKGAWGSFPPAERAEPITVLGVRGELAMPAETHDLGGFWNDGHGRNYQIKAVSRQMTKEELVRIAASLVPVSE